MTSEEKRKYQKQYRELNIHRVVIFSKEEYTLLLNEAEKHRKPFSTMVRELALASASQEYILPLDLQTNEVKTLLIRYGTNLNQIAHVCNSTKKISQETVVKIQADFTKMKNEVVKIYDKPMKVADLVRNTLIKTPSYAVEIRKILTLLHL